jgi:hypothetical protein
MRTILFIFTVIFFASCSKTVVLTDGVKTKEIKVMGNIKIDKNAQEQEYISFQTPRGTRYSIETSKYSYVIK